MFKQIFPGLSTLNGNHKTNDYKLQIAYMLMVNGADKVKSKLNSYKYTNQESTDIWFLIMISNPSKIIDKLLSIKSIQKNIKLTTSQVKEWSNMNNDKNILKVWNWKLSISPQEAISQGLKGKQIGDYMNDKEQELFVNT